MYIPDFKILKNQYTPGKQYSVKNTLKEYIGSYNILYTGVAYTGNTYNQVTSQELIPYQEAEKILTQSTSITFYDTIVEDKNIPKIKTFITPEPQYILPTQNEIEEGVFTRYFCKKINEIQVFEINKEIYNSILKKDGKYNYVLYEVIDVLWKLTGPLNDNTQDNIMIPGIIDTNYRTVKKANQKLNGLLSFITDYKKFAVTE
jgi:hypothetical protein